jgi:hypothetical protein
VDFYRIIIVTNFVIPPARVPSLPARNAGVLRCLGRMVVTIVEMVDHLPQPENEPNDARTVIENASRIGHSGAPRHDI